MADPAKNILIGLFVIAACFLIVGVLLFLHPTVGDCGKTLRVRFSDIDKINTGTRVTFAGRAVGEVLSITQLDGNRTGRTDRYGRVYMYELLLCVDSSVTVYSTDEITTYTSGLLGERSIGIVAQPVETGQPSRELDNAEVVYAKAAGSVDTALENLGELSDQARRALTLIGDLIEDNKDAFSDSLSESKLALAELRTLLNSANDTGLISTMEDVAQRIGRAMDGLDGQFAELDRQEIWLKMGDILTNISDITDGLNDPTKWQEIVANLHSMTEGLTDIGTRFDSTWERVDEGVVKFSSAMDNASLASTDLREIIGDIRDGKGTVGKILTRDDFYLRLNSLMSKADTLMNDINHYGLLFHRERGWQRERTKRMNQVQKLSTPQQFRDFFAEEVDGITTSLGRVHVMMEEADARSSCEDWIDEERFAKVFRELMLQIRGLHDSIELYNSELSSHTCQEACVGE